MKKIRIRGGSEWKNSETLCLAVSMESHACAGQNFLAALRFARSTDKKFFVDLSDTLHAPNLIARGATPEQARALASMLGDQWIDEHADHLDGVHVIRWPHWENHPDHAAVLGQFKRLYEIDSEFKAVIDQGVERFTARMPGRGNDAFHKASRDYCIAECTGKTLQGREYPGLVILYPGAELACLDAVRREVIKGVPDGLNATHHFRYTLETRQPAMPSNIQFKIPKAAIC